MHFASSALIFIKVCKIHSSSVYFGPFAVSKNCALLLKDAAVEWIDISYSLVIGHSKQYKRILSFTAKIANYFLPQPRFKYSLEY